MAVLLAQMKLLRELEARLGPRGGRGRVYQFAIDEEIGGNGSLSLAMDPRFAGSPMIVHECTELVPYCAHRGCVYYRCRLLSGGDGGGFELFPYVVTALDEEGERKILQIGANKVVTPYKLSGLRIAQALIRPTVVDFVDLIIRRKELSLYMEEFIVKGGAQIEDRTIRQCDIRREANVIVVATKKPGEDIVFNPSPDIKIEKGDTLLVLGSEEAIEEFEKKYVAP